MQALNFHQLQQKLSFIDNYLQATNAADGSKLDANANVTQKKYRYAGSRADERSVHSGKPGVS
uniref:hypothetical protein n=1 Tax=Rheinheimera sp. TaxID=1869214 RepID=UPI00404896DF